MITTASRSREYLRKQGYIAEVVEHRRGRIIRVDLFGFADVMAFDGKRILLVQAYHKSGEKHHFRLDSRHPIIQKWLQSGGLFHHHIWSYKTKNKRKYWSCETKEILPTG